MNHYTVIGQIGCEPCKKAIQALYDSGETFVEVKFLHNNEHLKTLLGMAGLKTVPQVFTPAGEHIGGYTDLVAYLENPKVA